MSKGSTPRPIDYQKHDEGYDLIKWKSKQKEGKSKKNTTSTSSK